MHVAYILPGLDIGGGVNVVLEHGERLVRRSHQVTVFSTEAAPECTWRSTDGIEIVSVHDLDHMVEAFATVPDVLVATGWQTVHELAWRRLPARSYGYFVQAYEPDFYPRDSYDGDLAAATYALPFSYLSEARWLCDKLLADFGHDTAYVRNGLNDVFHSPAEPLAPRGERLRILLEGPLENPRKRMDDAFLAVEGLDAEVWLVTSGGELAPWQRPHRLFRSVPLSLMPRIYASCDVIVKLSAVEGMFGPPLEMMSQGGVAVTSDVEGHDEFMRHGVNGFVVPVGDWKGARAALQRLDGDRSLLATIAVEARQTAAKFRWEPTIDALEQWLYRVSAQPRSTGVDIFRKARLGTRVYMERAWHVRSLDGRQALHGRLFAEQAGKIPSQVGLTLVSGWISSRHAPASWSATAPGGVVVDEAWRPRPDVVSTVEKVRAAGGFDLALLFPEEFGERATLELVEQSGETTIVELRSRARQPVGQGFFLDLLRPVATWSIDRPSTANTDVVLEIRGGVPGDEPPRAFVVRWDGSRLVAEPIDLTADITKRAQLVWTGGGIAVQRFFADSDYTLLVADVGFESDVRWVEL